MSLFWRKPSLRQMEERIEERRYGQRPIDPQETELLFWIGGDASIAEPLAATLRQLASMRPDGPVAFLIDDPSLAPRDLLSEFSARRELIASQPTDLPALLFRRALPTSAYAWCGFAWAGCEIGEKLLVSPDADLVHGDLPPPVPREIRPPVHRGWLEMADLVPMHHAIVRTEAVKRSGGVAVDPLLQRTFWWELTLRLARQGRIAHAPVASATTRWTWASYPFAKDDSTTTDLAGRYTVRRDRDHGRFLADLPASVASDAANRLSAWSRAHKLQPDESTTRQKDSPPFPLRVTIITEAIDTHHNELFFYPYFARLPGKGKMTCRTITYQRCRDEDLASADLVLMTRPRFPEVPALLDKCDAMRLPVVAMIDDNWIAAGREYPRFEALFTPGKPAFEIFLESMRRADAVLVYNSLMAEEFAPHARRVVQLPPNIDLSRFAGRRSRSSERLLIGFAGSPRWERSAFRALREFVERDLRADILIMAHEVPPELGGIPASRVTFVPWQEDVDRYGRALADAAPDIMLAPLDATRFSASKVAVKMYDAAGVGAAGIYSNVSPYTEEVTDGVNGLLVENNDDAWLHAMRRLAGDADLRGRIAASARQYVESRYSTDRLVDTFVAMLADVVGEARRQRGW